MRTLTLQTEPTTTPAIALDAVAQLVREELARRRISRRFLADRARISVSTLEKALAGRRPFTLATTLRLEEALGVALRRQAAPLDRPRPTELAPDELGSYARAGVGWLEGAYLTLRPSFADRGAIHAYRTDIAWNAAAGSLAFQESERQDAAFAQSGAVSLPHQSGHIYLVTNNHGQFRTVVLSRPTIGGELYGILTTLLVGRGAQLTPVAAPVALVPIAAGAPPAFGRIAPGHAQHAAYRRHLRRAVDEPFVVLMGE